MKDFGLDFMFVHKNNNGDILYNSGWEPNQVSDEGFKSMFDTYFRNNDDLTEAPVSFKVGLVVTDVTHPAQTSTYAQVAAIQPDNASEGYAEQPLTRNNTGFTALELSSGDMQITSASVTFTNTETIGGTTWDTVVAAYLATIGSTATYFFSWKALAVNRTLEPGDSLDVTVRQKGRQISE